MNELYVMNRLAYIRLCLLKGASCTMAREELLKLEHEIFAGMEGTPISVDDWVMVTPYISAMGHLDPPIQHFEVTFGVGTYTDLLWEIYQETGRYEDMTRWLKHAAWERLKKEGGI